MTSSWQRHGLILSTWQKPSTLCCLLVFRGLLLVSTPTYVNPLHTRTHAHSLNIHRGKKSYGEHKWKIPKCRRNTAVFWHSRPIKFSVKTRPSWCATLQENTRATLTCACKTRNKQTKNMLCFFFFFLNATKSKVFTHQYTAGSNPIREVGHAMIGFSENISVSWCQQVYKDWVKTHFFFWRQTILFVNSFHNIYLATGMICSEKQNFQNIIHS